MQTTRQTETQALPSKNSSLVRSQTLLTLVTLLTAALFVACGGGLISGDETQDQVWDDDVEEGERSTMFKHPPPPGAAPWTYALTSYGGSNDPSTYKKPPGCGGRVVDGAWWYATGAWSFGCGSKLELRANGKCVVVKVVDNGPASWVEQKVKGKCGGSGYVIDASPLASKHLFGQHSAGWSDCRMIQVSPVPAHTPEGPCSSSSPTPPLTPGCNKGQPFSWEHCSPSCPCGAGMGDCDSDSDCMPGLRCEHNVGHHFGGGPTVDVCTPQHQPPQQQPGAGCHPGAPMEWNFCNPSCPCAQGQGDCDSDADCMPGLRCAQNVGGKYGTAHNIDVCEQPTPQPSPPGGQCAYNGGNNHRKCRDCGWQFCLPNGTWSTACAPKPSLFHCPQGLFCDGNAFCR